MNKFRDRLRLQIWTYGVSIAVLLTLQVLAFMQIIVPIAGDDHWTSMWNGFIMGAAFGIMAMFIAGIVANARALRSEGALKKLFVKETDEREQSICTAARSAGARIFLAGGIVAGIVAGYFSISVSITIIACVFVHSLLCGALKLYYDRKY